MIIAVGSHGKPIRLARLLAMMVYLLLIIPFDVVSSSAAARNHNSPRRRHQHHSSASFGADHGSASRQPHPDAATDRHRLPHSTAGGIPQHSTTLHQRTTARHCSGYRHRGTPIQLGGASGAPTQMPSVPEMDPLPFSTDVDAEYSAGPDDRCTFKSREQVTGCSSHMSGGCASSQIRHGPCKDSSFFESSRAAPMSEAHSSFKISVSKEYQTVLQAGRDLPLIESMPTCQALDSAGQVVSQFFAAISEYFDSSAMMSSLLIIRSLKQLETCLQEGVASFLRNRSRFFGKDPTHSSLLMPKEIGDSLILLGTYSMVWDLLSQNAVVAISEDTNFMRSKDDFAELVKNASHCQPFVEATFRFVDALGSRSGLKLGAPAAEREQGFLESSQRKSERLSTSSDFDHNSSMHGAQRRSRHSAVDSASWSRPPTFAMPVTAASASGQSPSVSLDGTSGVAQSKTHDPMLSSGTRGHSLPPRTQSLAAKDADDGTASLHTRRSSFQDSAKAFSQPSRGDAIKAHGAASSANPVGKESEKRGLMEPTELEAVASLLNLNQDDSLASGASTFQHISHRDEPSAAAGASDVNATPTMPSMKREDSGSGAAFMPFTGQFHSVESHEVTSRDGAVTPQTFSRRYQAAACSSATPVGGSGSSGAESPRSGTPVGVGPTQRVTASPISPGIVLGNSLASSSAAASIAAAVASSPLNPKVPRSTRSTGEQHIHQHHPQASSSMPRNGSGFFYGDSSECADDSKDAGRRHSASGGHQGDEAKSGQTSGGGYGGDDSASRCSCGCGESGTYSSYTQSQSRTGQSYCSYCHGSRTGTNLSVYSIEQQHPDGCGSAVGSSGAGGTASQLQYLNSPHIAAALSPAPCNFGQVHFPQGLVPEDFDDFSASLLGIVSAQGMRDRSMLFPDPESNTEFMSLSSALSINLMQFLNGMHTTEDIVVSYFRLLASLMRNEDGSKSIVVVSPEWLYRRGIVKAFLEDVRLKLPHGEEETEETLQRPLTPAQFLALMELYGEDTINKRIMCPILVDEDRQKWALLVVHTGDFIKQSMGSASTATSSTPIMPTALYLDPEGNRPAMRDVMLHLQMLASKNSSSAASGKGLHSAAGFDGSSTIRRSATTSSGRAGTSSSSSFSLNVVQVDQLPEAAMHAYRLIGCLSVHQYLKLQNKMLGVNYERLYLGMHISGPPSYIPKMINPFDSGVFVIYYGRLLAEFKSPWDRMTEVVVHRMLRNAELTSSFDLKALQMRSRISAELLGGFLYPIDDVRYKDKWDRVPLDNMTAMGRERHPQPPPNFTSTHGR